MIKTTPQGDSKKEEKQVLIPKQTLDEGADRAISSTSNYGTLPSLAFSATEGIHPYTRENRPNRRPFHLPCDRPTRVSAEEDSHLYTRFRYYSRLRAPACPSDHALVIPDHIIPVDFFVPYIPQHLKDSEGKQSSFITIIAVWNTMMGTSLLTMPWAFGEAGFLGGFFIMIGMGALCLYTAIRILTLQKTMNLEGELHEITYLCRYLWYGSVGKAIEGLAITFSLMTLLGALVVYWVLMSNFLYNTGEAIYGAVSGQITVNSSNTAELLCPGNGTKADIVANVSFDEESNFHQFWTLDLSVPLFLLIPFVFLVSIRDPAVFTYFNSFGAISVIAICTFVMAKGIHWGFNFTLSDYNDPGFVPLFKSKFMALSGTLSLAYFIHNCIITIMRGNKYPENNVRDLSISFLLVAMTYIPVGVIFYLTFPLPKYCIADNLLNNFPPHNMVLAIVRAFLLFQMLTVYPLLTCLLRTQLLTYILGPGVPHTFPQMTAINATTLLICLLVAIFYPNIGFLIRWVGAISGLAYIFILPCVGYMQAINIQKQLTWKELIPHCLIVTLGLANFVAQFFLG